MGRRTVISTRILLLCSVLLCGLLGPAARDGGSGAWAAGFGAYRADVKPADVFAGADKFGPLEGTPPAIAAYRGEAIIGYVFDTSDIGYSGKPIRIRAGIDRDGTITGAKVIEHHEPILLVGISPDKLFDFVARHAGRNIIDMSREAASKEVDVISGATVTAVVINDGIMRTALALAKSRGIAGFPRARCAHRRKRRGAGRAYDPRRYPVREVGLDDAARRRLGPPPASSEPRG